MFIKVLPEGKRGLVWRRKGKEEGKEEGKEGEGGWEVERGEFEQGKGVWGVGVGAPRCSSLIRAFSSFPSPFLPLSFPFFLLIPPLATYLTFLV